MADLSSMIDMISQSSPTVKAHQPSFDPNQILSEVFKQYPRLAAVNDPKNTQVIYGSPDRTKLAGENQLEYWPAQETGTPDFPHPSPGKTTLEIFNPQLQQNPDLLKTAVFGDLLHGLRNDPTYNALREQFKSGFTPQQMDFEKKQGRSAIDDSRLDEYVRGYLANDSTDGFVQDYKAGKPVYSPKQIKTMELMKKYIGGKD